jgi:hypothetical protein
VIPVYVGFDPREEAGTHVFNSSLINRSTSPVSITPLHLPLFRSFYSAGHRDGTNAFAYTRFLIPFLQDFRGWALFVDGADMLMRADVSELWALRDDYKAVQVVKHDYKTKHPRKYVGTKMEARNDDYPCKNWSSVMLINCGHFAWRQMTPENVEKIADEYGQNDEAKLVHWTAGVPAFEHYAQAPHANEFFLQLAQVNHVTD